MVLNTVHVNTTDCPVHTIEAGKNRMDNICKNIFRCDNIQILKEILTKKMADLINNQANIWYTKDGRTGLFLSNLDERR